MYTRLQGQRAPTETCLNSALSTSTPDKHAERQINADGIFKACSSILTWCEQSSKAKEGLFFRQQEYTEGQNQKQNPKNVTFLL